MSTSLWSPHPGPQTEFLERSELEALFGGAAGPGKTDCLISGALRYWAHPLCSAVLFRRTFTQLTTIIDRCFKIIPLIDPKARYKSTEHRWYGSSGATLNLSHMQHENDKYDHQGADYTYIGFDELTQFSETQYLYLISRCRSLADEIIRMIRASANPGGTGHAWVKKRWRIGSVEPRTVITNEVLGLGGEIIELQRIFIPATLDDNPTLLEKDPEYLARLELLPPLEAKRLRYGLWDAFEGQAFAEVNEDVHGFDFDIPPEWEVFGSFDWGSAKPFSYALYAVDFDDNIWRFAEFYGAVMEGDEFVDKGLRLNDSDIARGIIALEHEFKVKPRYRVADPAIWSKRPAKGQAMPGPSPEEVIRKEGVSFRKADNARIAGRRELHNRFALDEETGKPSFYIHKRCKSFWQYFPILVEDERNPEDILQKDVADHDYDQTRYAVMSRPMRSKKVAKPDVGSFQWERRKYLEAKRRAQRHGVSLEQAYRG